MLSARELLETGSIFYIKDKIRHPSWSNNIETSEGGNLILNGGTEGPDSHLVLPESLKMRLLKALCSAVRHGTGKIIQIMKKYWCGDCFKVAKLVYDQCLICQAHNPAKTIKVLDGAFPPPTGSFEHLQTDFIRFPPATGYRYVLVIVCSQDGLKPSRAERLTPQSWLKSF